MVDPMDALLSLQPAIESHRVELQPCALFTDLALLIDYPNGHKRTTYVRQPDGVAAAIVMVAEVDPYEGLPCFQLGYAVLTTHRGRGIGLRIVEDAIAELRHDLKRAGLKAFYVEAVVSPSNVPSNKIASRLIAATPSLITDMDSGEPALQYLRRIEGSNAGRTSLE